MQVFNVGVLELLFILIIAFIVLGPRRAIQTARQVGVWVRNLVRSPFWRDILRTSNEIRDLPKKIMDDAELQHLIEELDLSTQDIKQMITQAQTETEAELQSIEGEISQGLNANPVPSDKLADDS